MNERKQWTNEEVKCEWTVEGEWTKRKLKLMYGACANQTIEYKIKVKGKTEKLGRKYWIKVKGDE